MARWVGLVLHQGVVVGIDGRGRAAPRPNNPWYMSPVPVGGENLLHRAVPPLGCRRAVRALWFFWIGISHPLALSITCFYRGFFSEKGQSGAKPPTRAGLLAPSGHDWRTNAPRNRALATLLGAHRRRQARPRSSSSPSISTRRARARSPPWQPLHYRVEVLGLGQALLEVPKTSSIRTP